jgi:predicted lipoprotein with Yx(FWY)xxD motif
MSRHRPAAINRIHSLVAVLCLGIAVTSLAAESHGNSIPKTANINLPYPGQIDLEQEAGGWTYRLNQNELPLYMSTADPPGKSSCSGACAKQWLPVIAEASAKPIGDWSIVVREDGQRQWAFKDHPVYTHVNDSSEHATGVSGSFHLMPHFH